MTTIGPGGTIGIIGGGQLARMLALEARRMGYRVAVLDPDPTGPAGQVADVCVTGRLDDGERARALAALSHVVTLDTEHVPADVLADLEALTLVRPSSAVLRIVQDRLAQRRFIASLGIPQVRHASVSAVEALLPAARTVGFPCILKTRRSGYDGKGQVRVERPDDLVAAWQAIGEAPAVLEAFVDFEREVSALLARAVDGSIRSYPVAENAHRRHILHTTRVPARISAALDQEAEAIGARVAAALGHVGMLAVELFVTRDGSLLVNEIAPRTHNSGHYTFGACATSQFEQHTRAICGLPLGDASLLRPAVMLNLLGDLWSSGPPAWDAVLAQPSARLHLYGKASPTAGRKMGHVLVLDENGEVAAAVAESIAARLDRSIEGQPARALDPAVPSG